jgi:Zn-dependent alcohol dehydrogenase
LRRPGFALEQLVQRQVALDQINDGMELARTQQAIKVLVRLS